jgi:hypothetical protein
MNNNLDFNSTVIQSTGLTLFAGLGGAALDRVFPAARPVTSAAEFPMLFAEVVTQLSVNQVGLKILTEFLGKYTNRSSYLSLLGAVILPMVQPNLLAKLGYMYQGTHFLSNPSFIKVSNTGSIVTGGTVLGAPDVKTTGGYPTGAQIIENNNPSLSE